MSLALLTRGYVSPPALDPPPNIEIGKGPAIVRAVEIRPTIDRGRELAPRIILGEEEVI